MTVIVRDAPAIRAMAGALPATGPTTHDAKCDVMFLTKDVDREDILGELTIKPGIDEVIYVKGAIIRRVERTNATRSGMMKIVGTDLYARMTVRNCNTLRKLDALMHQ